MTPNQRQKDAFHTPLKHADSEKQTVGCRHTNPSICANHSLPKVCAFVRADGMCLKPPVSWPKQFRVLAGAAGTGREKP